jgi:hypothetical protein
VKLALSLRRECGDKRNVGGRNIYDLAVFSRE